MNYQPKMGDIILMNFDPSLGHEQKGQRKSSISRLSFCLGGSNHSW